MERTASPAVVELADRLWDAERTGVPIPPPAADDPQGGGATVEDAYAVQQHNVGRRLARGAVVRGRKVGLTSLAVQRMLGVDEPTFGTLLDDMFVEPDEEIRHADLIAPRAEAEIAFRLGADLAGPGVTTVTALAAVDAVMPAVEVGDSRIADWRLGLVDTVADNASSARVVLGSRLRRVHDLDLRLLGVLFSRNGVPVTSGAGAAALGHPGRCLAWLANRLGRLGGGLAAGDVVLTGALHRMVPVRAGDVVRAEFAHLGAVGVRFTAAEDE